MLTDQNTQWYLESIEHEMAELQKGRFTGNVVFQINYKDGNVGNANIGLNKSIQNPDRTIKR